MQQKNSLMGSPTRKYLELAVKTKSFSPVLRNGWYIKFSIYRDTNILLNILSTQTGQLIVRYFIDENDACMFLNYIMDLDSAKQYEL
jgi:hypothetical protein